MIKNKIRVAQMNDKKLKNGDIIELDVLKQSLSARVSQAEFARRRKAYKPHPPTTGNMLQTARYETFDFHPPMDNMKMTKHPRRNSGHRRHYPRDRTRCTAYRCPGRHS